MHGTAYRSGTRAAPTRASGCSRRPCRTESKAESRSERSAQSRPASAEAAAPVAELQAHEGKACRSTSGMTKPSPRQRDLTSRSDRPSTG